jgi:hypothetical protein
MDDRTKRVAARHLRASKTVTVKDRKTGMELALHLGRRGVGDVDFATVSMPGPQDGWDEEVSWDGPIGVSERDELEVLYGIPSTSIGRCKIHIMQDMDHITGREPGTLLEVTVHLPTFPDRRGTKVTFSIDTEAHSGRVVAGSRTASGRTKTNIYTGQYYNSRVIEAYEDWSGTKDELQEAFKRLDNGWIEKAARDYTAKAAGQSGLSVHDFEIQIGSVDGEANIDMKNWPEGMGFDSWFRKWARKWDIEVHD